MNLNKLSARKKIDYFSSLYDTMDYMNIDQLEAIIKECQKRIKEVKT
jgi:hypothetical protein